MAELTRAKLTKISQGDLWATKTYVNDFSESPDGIRVLYRYFPDPANQPPNIADRAHGAAVWMCDRNGENHVKLFDIPSAWHEAGHGSESMVWVSNDRFYYNGILYRFSDEIPGQPGRILWFLPNPADERREISAWSYPAKGKLFVNIRTGANAGYYWLDPFCDTVPELHIVIDRDTILPFLAGTPEEYQFTYLFLSTGGSHLYFVIYYKLIEYAFTCREDGTGMVRIGDNNAKHLPWNGHTVWFDDEQLAFPCSPEGNTKMCDRFGGNMRVAAGKSNHVTLSPDRKWVACDDWERATWNPTFMRLYPFGSTEAVCDMMGPDQTPTIDVRIHAHPSFSRDGRGVFYLGRNGDSAAVYYADLSKWTEK